MIGLREIDGIAFDEQPDDPYRSIPMYDLDDFLFGTPRDDEEPDITIDSDNYLPEWWEYLDDTEDEGAFA